MFELTAEQVRRTFTGESIAEILKRNQDVSSEIGGKESFFGLEQKRFFDGLKRGVEIGGPAHHVFVTGLGGRSLETVADCLRGIVALSPRRNLESKDLICLHNFKNPACPNFVFVPKSLGPGLKESLRELSDSLQKKIPKMFEKGGEADLAFNAYKLERWEDFRNKMAEIGFIFRNGRLAPASRKKSEDGALKPLSEEEFNAFSELELADFQNQMTQAQNMTQELNADMQKKLTFIQDCAMTVFCESSFAELTDLLQKFNVQKKVSLEESLPVLSFVQELKGYVLENKDLFMDLLIGNNFGSNGAIADNSYKKRMFLLPFEVNVLIDRSSETGPPVVVEKNPKFNRLVGKIGAYLGPDGHHRTDHTKISVGSLLRANEGFLIVDLMDVFRSPGSYQVLMNSVKSRQLEITTLAAFFGYEDMSDFRPEPIPFNLKLILCGDEQLWHLLCLKEPGFKDVFEIKAHVLPQVAGDERQIAAFASWARKFAKNHGLSRLTDESLGKLVEHGMRLADSREKISTDFLALASIIREADGLVNGEGDIGPAHIQEAINKKFWRSDALYERIQELIAEGTILVDVNGEKVGQVNALAVYDMGDVSFAKPSRITADAYPSPKPDFIGIEKASKLGGNILGKAELILQSWLRSKYGCHAPFGVSISTAFEQSYSGVEGDSASLAEVCVILSAITGVPIRQSVAITGSMNQHGEVQPIGGVNEKVQGFFDVCRACGQLTGNQGVIIPHQNVKNLMLREDVAEAVEKKEFHVWPAETVADCVSVLTGMEFGESSAGSGSEERPNPFSENSFNYLVVEKLREFFSLGKQLYGQEKENK